MVLAGQLRRELAPDPAVRSPGRHGGPPGPGGAHVPAGGAVGPHGPGPVAPAAEPSGAGGVSAGDGPAPEPQGVSARAPLPFWCVAAAGGRAAAAHPGPKGALDRRGAPGHGAPQGGHLRLVPAAPMSAGRPVSRSSGIRGALHGDRHPDGGRSAARPHRLRGLGEPADGAPFRPARGVGGGDRFAARTASVHPGPGRGGGGPGHGPDGDGSGAGARIRRQIAPAAGGFPGAAPRCGAP